MSKVILGTTISLDGFIDDRNGSVGALYPDLTHAGVHPRYGRGGDGTKFLRDGRRPGHDRRELRVLGTNIRSHPPASEEAPE